MYLPTPKETNLGDANYHRELMLQNWPA